MHPEPRSTPGSGDMQDPLSIHLDDKRSGPAVDVRSLVLEVSDELGIVLGDDEPPPPPDTGQPVVPPMLVDPDLSDIVSRVMQLRAARAAAAAPVPAPVVEAAQKYPAPSAAPAPTPAPASAPMAAPVPAPVAEPVPAAATEFPATRAMSVPEAIPTAAADTDDVDDGLNVALDDESFREHREQLFHPPEQKNDRRLWRIAAAVTILLLVLLAFTAYRSGTFNRLLPDGWKSRPAVPGHVHLPFIPIHRFVSTP